MNLDEDIEPHILTTQPTYPFGEFEKRWRITEQERVNDISVTRLFTYQPTDDTVLGRVLNYGVFSVLSSLYVLATFWRYDQIVTMSTPHTTFLPGLVGKITGLSWVIDIFDLWIDNAADLGYVEKGSLPYWLVRLLEEISFKYSDEVFVVTETMAEHYERRYPEREFDIHTVPFGMDTDSFSPDIDSMGTIDIIYTGNLGTCQAFTPFFEAFAKLEEDAVLTIIGDGERRKELESLVETLDITDRVSFEGYVPRGNIPHLLAGAKISLVPLKTEYELDYARPTKLLETMAVGTPYVASDVKEMKKLSEKYSTGFAVENDSEEISEAMSTLLSDSSLRMRMAKNGREVIESQHDWSEIGDMVSAILNRLYQEESSDESTSRLTEDRTHQ
ncbi:glycosyltransferase family 4 protein [Natronomonas salina]|uniref:glycosyltransferase family 4 protein n=1 Tax=Natronomonas salina TaxID=1710540 RepID=UPI0015B4FC86|nr:glycosyltransferase family 4 protein [Natronomonas salina]QLD88765.1 glycosyltransferase family 4 protein [Natronomonas salina]